MKSLKELFVAHVVEEATKRAADGRALRVLDVGCGTANYVPGLVEQYPDITYVGIEPITASYEQALVYTQDLSQATVHFGLAYDALTEYADESFDVIISLSVLEHVKRLPEFMQFCNRYLAPGGMMVHRYDLGHALYTHSWKEWLHVRLGNNAPWILPETQFVRYVPEAEVRATYEAVGIVSSKSTYHQMPNAKALEKHLRDTNSTATEELFAWELAHQNEFAAIPTDIREKQLPSIAVWGEKKR